MNDPVFNSDELAAQRLAGGGPRGNGIQDFLPEQHRRFLTQLPQLFVSVIDAAGWPLATMLSGPPGFVQSPDSVTLHLTGRPDPHDPAATAFAFDREIGLLGIDLATRRRVRVNGRIIDLDALGITVAVDQSFGNGPQYIQLRTPAAAPREAAGSAPAEPFVHLDAAAQAAIAQADTFFVASRSRSGNGMAFGTDVSHRGGLPGFIRIDGDVLNIPDFRGNRYFNTLGNLLADPRASLLFVDFENGDLLQLQGTAAVDWDAAAAAQIAGAERLWRFRLAQGWRRKAGAPLRWSFVEYSSSTVRAGQPAVQR